MKTSIRIVVALSIMIITLSACDSDQADKTPVDAVTVQLKWIHQAQFAGFYVAKEQGYYADENISVTFVEGGAGTNPVGQVADGQADFGVDGADRVLASRGQGNQVVAIAVIFRKDPLAFVTMADSGITKPADFLGRTAGIGNGQVDLQFKTMMNNLGLDIDQVTILPYMNDYSNFFDGQADISLGYSTGGIIRIRQAGYDINLIWPADYGVHLYADTLITTDQLITENPDLVTRFLRASLKGWRSAVENPDMAVNATLNYAAAEHQDMQSEMFDAVIPLVHTGEDQIGWMRDSIWQDMYVILLEQDLLNEPLDLNDVYTMHFLEEIYEEN